MIIPSRLLTQVITSDALTFSKVTANHLLGIDTGRMPFIVSIMSRLEAIEAEIKSWPRVEAERLQDWLSDYLEDHADLNAEFVASIERGNADLAAGRARVQKPS
jgi:hypothetical protein